MATKNFLELTGDVKMPVIGLGTLLMSDESQVRRALNEALESGYRHIDTAYIYRNEKLIGQVLKQRFDSGKLKREDIFITTKLPMLGVHPDRVEYFMKKSLENLQLDYVDLYLIHFPIGLRYDINLPEPPNHTQLEAEAKTDHEALWKKMEDQVKAGRTRSIGLSNYNISQIETVLKTATIKPANLQVEMHVFLQQRDLVNFCRRNGISVVAYCPLGAPGRNETLKRLNLPPKKLPNVLGNSLVEKMAEKHSKTPAQIVLRFLMQLGVVPIPKSVTPQRIRENISVFDFSLDDEEMTQLSGLDVGESARIAEFTWVRGYETHPDFPFKK